MEMLKEMKNMVHIAESTVGRRYAGWFIRNTEHAQRVLDALRASPLPISTAIPASASTNTAGAKTSTSTPKSAWGSVKKVEVVA